MSRGSRRKVLHQREACIGCGACSLLAPGSWRLEEGDGKATLLGARPEGEFFRLDLLQEEVGPHQEAARACPVEIIRVE